MRQVYVTIIMLISFIGCQPKQDIATDKKAVETVLRDFFAAITKYDYQSLRNQCTDTYQLIEHGLWWNADSLINELKKYEGKATLTYTFDDIKTDVEGSVAWMTYKNHGLLTMGDKQTQYECSESAVFKKQNGAWKMLLLHSTRTNPK